MGLGTPSFVFVFGILSSLATLFALIRPHRKRSRPCLPPESYALFYWAFKQKLYLFNPVLHIDDIIVLFLYFFQLGILLHLSLPLIPNSLLSNED